MTTSEEAANPPEMPLRPGSLAQIACVLEVSARKPGNVHRSGDLDTLHFLDFLLSAVAIGDALDQASSRSLGETILAAVRATRRVVTTNTNLGMILLLGPLASVEPREDLSRGVQRRLAATTVEDSRLVYEAIRLAAPGGLGRVSDQDLSEIPTMPLRETMSLAADRDLLARQYANGFNEVLLVGRPLLQTSLDQGQPLETAIVSTFLGLLARYPDSLIVRKHGPSVAATVSVRAAAILDEGWPDSETSQSSLDAFDAWLRSESNRLNPGTTADLVTAILFAALRDGKIPLPRQPGAAGWSHC